MEYRMIGYSILNENECVDGGLIPYKGEDASAASIRHFVLKHFPILAYKDIKLEVIKAYEDEHEWIISVHQLKAFMHLRSVENYAGDLLDKYGLPRMKDEAFIPIIPSIEELNDRLN
jgi:hypothetical protein